MKNKANNKLKLVENNQEEKEQELQKELKVIYGENLEDIIVIDDMIMPQIKQGNFNMEVNNITIAKIKTEKGVLYKLYNLDGMCIATMDDQGNFEYNMQYLMELREEMPLYFGKMGLSIKQTKTIAPQIVEKIEAKKIDEDEISKQSNNENEIKETIGEEIKSYVEIDTDTRITKNDTIGTLLPNGSKFEKIAVVADKNNRFRFIGINSVNGRKKAVELENELKQTEGLNPSKTIASFDRKGEKVEETQVSSMYRINDVSRKNEGFTIDIDQFGDIKVNYYRRTAENEYMQIPVETQTQRCTTKEVRETMDVKNNVDLSDEYDKYNRNKKLGMEEQGMKDISDNISNDELYLENGEVTTFEKEARKDKISVNEFKKIFEEAEGRTTKEKLENTHQEIENQFRNPRNRR